MLERKLPQEKKLNSFLTSPCVSCLLTELDDFESDKRFQARLAHKKRTKRVHIQEGSGDTTDTQKSNQHREEQFARQVEAAQQLRRTAKLYAGQCHRVIELFDERIKDLENGKF